MAAISAVATIVAAVIAGIFAINSGQVHVSLTDPADEVDEVRATATSLERDNERLSDENAGLAAELEAASATPVGERAAGDTTDVTSGPTTRESTVRRQTGTTPLTFTWGYAVDLDTMDADWSVGNGSNSETDVSLNGSTGRLYTDEVVLFDHVPTEAECRDATVRQPSLNADQSVEGALLCVLTTDDRYAFVRIATIDEEQRTTSLDVMVWE